MSTTDRIAAHNRRQRDHSRLGNLPRRLVSTVDLTIDSEVTDVPDDDDVLLLSERPVTSSHALHSVIRAVGGLPQPGQVLGCWREISQHPATGIKTGDVLGLRTKGDYVRIYNIYVHRVHQDCVAIHGLRFRESRRLPGGFNHSATEVAVMQDVFTDSIPNCDDFCLEVFTPADIRIDVRRRISMTNRLRHSDLRQGRLTDFFPTGMRGVPEPSSLTGTLVCRSIWSTYHNGAHGRSGTRKVQEVWQNLDEHHADPGQRIEDRLYRLQRREIHRHSRRYHTGHPSNKYTAMDGFCGAGFASAGAEMARMEVIWSFDNNPDAVRTYSKNHRNVRVLLADFFDVVQRYGDRIKVDILMLSFPCQFFSPAHTRPGRNDDANEVAGLGLGDILAAVKPRLVVVEQTYGLDQPRFRDHLLAIIAGFRNQDYSVRKGVLNFAGLGLAGHRRRLIFVGAAPGERLPHFPRPTHNTSLANPDRSLSNAMTTAEVLRQVYPSHPDHDFRYTRLHSPVAPINPRTTQLNTFTCSRSRNERHTVHFSGKRWWTFHELMLLQGAPAHYCLASGLGIQAKVKQIGNAFPPVAAKAIYEECVNSLQETDEADQLADALLQSSAAAAAHDEGETRQTVTIDRSAVGSEQEADPDLEDFVVISAEDSRDSGSGREQSRAIGQSSRPIVIEDDVVKGAEDEEWTIIGMSD